MNKSKQYGFNFTVIRNDGFLPFPIITFDTDMNGNPINTALGKFIMRSGANYTLKIIDDINSIESGNLSENDYNIYAQDEYESFSVLSPPVRGLFCDGAGDIIVSKQDLIELLNEWITYLNSLSFEHRFSGK